jgi:hypothetical protein
MHSCQLEYTYKKNGIYAYGKTGMEKQAWRNRHGKTGVEKQAWKNRHGKTGMEKQAWKNRHIPAGTAAGAGVAEDIEKAGAKAAPVCIRYNVSIQTRVTCLAHAFCILYNRSKETFPRACFHVQHKTGAFERKSRC